MEIFLKDYVVAMPIGVFAHEKGVLQKIRWNVRVTTRSDLAIKNDTLAETFSYDDIVAGILSIAKGDHIHLLETAANELAGRLIQNPMIDAITIELEKLDIYHGAGIPGVRISMARKNNLSLMGAAQPPFGQAA